MRLFLILLILFIFFCVFYKTIQETTNKLFKNINENLENQGGVPGPCPDGWLYDGSNPSNGCIVPSYTLATYDMPNVTKILWLDPTNVCINPIQSSDSNVKEYLVWLDTSSISSQKSDVCAKINCKDCTLFYAMGPPHLTEYINNKSMKILTFSNSNFAYTDNVVPDYTLKKTIDTYKHLENQINTSETEISSANKIEHTSPKFKIGTNSFGMFILCQIYSTGYIFSKCKAGSTTSNSGSIGDIEVYVTPDNNGNYAVHFNIQDGNSADNIVSGIKSGDWCLLELIYDRNTKQCSFYCNANLVSSFTISPNKILDNDYNMIIAASNDKNGKTFERELTYTETRIATDINGKPIEKGSIIETNVPIIGNITVNDPKKSSQFVDVNDDYSYLVCTENKKIKLELQYQKISEPDTRYNEPVKIQGEVIVIGGGGAGGSVFGGWEGGGGGGAGQYKNQIFDFTLGNHIGIFIGSGGSGKDSTNGNPSLIVDKEANIGVIAVGGGHGGIGNGGQHSVGNDSLPGSSTGGGGGGGNGWASVHSGGKGGSSDGKSRNGGKGEWMYGAGGGGGYDTDGAPTNGEFGGKGGAGREFPQLNNITSNTILCMGGCGGGNRTSKSKTANNSRGGEGGQAGGNGNDGLIGGCGGGGAGGGGNAFGGNGGSGLVIIRFKTRDLKNIKFTATTSKVWDEARMRDDPNYNINITRSYTNNTPANYFTGSIGEIVAYTYDDKNGDTHRLEMETYFLGKWHLYHLFTTEKIIYENSKLNIGNKPFVTQNGAGAIQDTHKNTIASSVQIVTSNETKYGINFAHDEWCASKDNKGTCTQYNNALKSWLNTNNINWSSITNV